MPERDLQDFTLGQLEQRLEDVDQQLESLAQPSMRGGVGAIGYRSGDHADAANTEWIQIELGEAVDIEQVVLVPMIWRDADAGFQADGFPLEFQVVVGTNVDPSGTIVASYTAQDRLLPRVAPLVVPCQVAGASWVRLEATILSPRRWNGRHVLQLSEVLVFNGQENVALHKPVHISSANAVRASSLHPRCLVDGFVPYLMDACEGHMSRAFFTRLAGIKNPTLSIDLGKARSINRIHLHSIDTNSTVPQFDQNDFSFPRRLLVEAANTADGSDAVRLFEYQVESVDDVGPIIMQSFSETVCRYIRLIVAEPYIGTIGSNTGPLIGFAEIEVFSHGKNVARDKPVSANFPYARHSRTLDALTDGHNFFGRILPVRDWTEQLARRHALETARPFIVAELNHRYQRQKRNLVWTSWLAGLLAVGIGLAILIERLLSMRQVARIQRRFAADLHDELGANLHTIGLLGDVALSSTDEPKRLHDALRRSRELTERSGEAVRHWINREEDPLLYSNLPDDMRRTAQRILADLEFDISFEGEEFLGKLSARTRADLFLFFKECLVNISRHARATQFRARVTANDKEISLSVSDNGRGASDSEKNGVPPSLKRRAELLGARVSVGEADNGGTCVTLRLRRRRLGFWR